MPDHFILHSEYAPTGDQPEAIAQLTEGVNSGLREQALMGVTGSGKTFTMANVIARTNRPTLVLAHNKTLAAQLCSEFKEFFPENAVEYFVSSTTTTSQKPILPILTPILKRTAPSTKKLKNSATPPLLPCRNGGM